MVLLSLLYFQKGLIMTKKPLDCVTSNCRIYVKYSLDSLLVTPFEECTADVKKLFSYFLHNAPNIESIHSEKIPNELHDSIFDRMINDRHFKYQNFCNSNASINKELEKGYLLGDSVCLKCKRFVCKKKKTVNLNSLKAIQNAFYDIFVTQLLIGEYIIGTQATEYISFSKTKILQETFQHALYV